jgi:sulfur carrier protein
MAKIYVNGDAQEVTLPLNVSELIQQNNVQQPEMVSVQVNEEFADSNEWDSIQLKEGDKVDFLYFMGGGQAFDNWTIYNWTIAAED